MALSDVEHRVTDRRFLMKLAAMAAATVPVTAAASVSRPTEVPPPLRQRLASDHVTVAAIQGLVRSVRPGDAHAATAANLAAMRDAIDRLHAHGGHKDLITFSAFALQGWVGGGFDDLRAAAIDSEGPEVAALGAKAREHGSHISFGAWATDRAWPGRVIAMMILIGPDGRVLARDWAPYIDATVLPDAGRHASSIESEFAAFVSIYGDDAVLPVHATPIGTLAQSQLNAAPEVFRALALKGAEILVRASPLGSQPWDLRATAALTQCFTVSTQSATSTDTEFGVPGSSLRAGGTAIFGPHGDVLAEAGSKWEQAVVATLPVGPARQARTVPRLAAHMVGPVYSTHAKGAGLA
jgi:predicted amidohydrolase